jgi:hypothetical protein
MDWALFSVTIVPIPLIIPDYPPPPHPGPSFTPLSSPHPQDPLSLSLAQVHREMTEERDKLRIATEQATKANAEAKIKAEELERTKKAEIARITNEAHAREEEYQKQLAKIKKEADQAEEEFYKLKETLDKIEKAVKRAAKFLHYNYISNPTVAHEVVTAMEDRMGTDQLIDKCEGKSPDEDAISPDEDDIPVHSQPPS